jgi:5-deoxy-5-amino-3-dehydroquinate synthase
VLDRIPLERVDAHFAVVAEEYGLATDLPSGLEPARLVELMRRDKKALDGLTFVLDGPTGVEVVAGVDESAVLRALDRMAP